ncbi:Outer membrane protein (fragment) [Alteromonas infernus]
MNTRYLFILLSFLVSSLFSISSVAAETLSAITNNTTQRLKQIYNVNPEKLQDNVKSINRWLQGPASLQLIALPSNTQGGTDEYEVGCFFPFGHLRAES